MKKFIRIGVDLAKNYFQVHALESEGGRIVSRKLTRAGMFKFFANRAVPGGHGGLWFGALLGARAQGDGPRGQADAAKLRQALCETRQERHG